MGGSARLSQLLELLPLLRQRVGQPQPLRNGPCSEPDEPQ